MLTDGEPFEVNILPSAMMDIVRGRYFYDQFEFGLGLRFRDYIVGEIDKLQENAGVDPMRMNYHYRLANRFHQTIYYRMEGRIVTVWRRGSIRAVWTLACVILTGKVRERLRSKNIKNARGEPRALFIPRRIRRQVVIGRQRLMCIWKGRKTNE